MIPVASARLPRKGAGAFGAARDNGRTHNGIDLAARRGEKVRAAQNGEVVQAVSAWREGFSGYGRTVVLAHADGSFTLYGHLETVDVEVGDPVTAGDVIGTAGNSTFTGEHPTRESGGVHVHFEASPTPYPQARTAPRLDPVAYLHGLESREAEGPLCR